MESMKKVFITGGTGFVGSHLIDFLLAQRGIEIFALVRDPNNLKWLNGLNIHILKGDLFSIPALPAGLDTVFHLAGLTKALKSENYYTVNQKGTASLFENLKARGLSPKVIHLSSLSAGGPSSGDAGVSEEATPHPVSPYSMSKLRGEEEALKYKSEMPVIIVRVGGVYGPRDEDFFQYFRAVQKGLLASLGGGVRPSSLCYVKDLCRALTLIADAPLKSGEIFNIAASISTTYEELGQAVANEMGKKPVIIRFPIPLSYLAALGSEILSRVKRKPAAFSLDKWMILKQKGWVADVRKAETILSFKTRYSLEEGVRETLAWYRENNWL
jgi:nucleoside-diphosphate-sugar epimerase